MAKDLTPKQEAFARAVAEGKSQADAYRIAFNVRPTTKPETIQNNASNLMRSTGVSARVAELKKDLANRSLWTREQSVAVLSEIAFSEAAREGDRVRAVAELNSMHGFDAPQKFDLSNSDGSLRPTTITIVAAK